MFTINKMDDIESLIFMAVDTQKSVIHQFVYYAPAFGHQRHYIFRYRLQHLVSSINNLI